jgi:hypothetical protein
MTRTVALLSVLALAYLGQCDTTTVVSVSVAQKVTKPPFWIGWSSLKKVYIYITEKFII